MSRFCEWIVLNVDGMCMWNEHTPQLEELCLKLSFAIGISTCESWAPLWRKCLFTYRLVDFMRFDMWLIVILQCFVNCGAQHPLAQANDGCTACISRSFISKFNLPSENCIFHICKVESLMCECFQQVHSCIDLFVSSCKGEGNGEGWDRWHFTLAINHVRSRNNIQEPL